MIFTKGSSAPVPHKGGASRHPSRHVCVHQDLASGGGHVTVALPLLVTMRKRPTCNARSTAKAPIQQHVVINVHSKDDCESWSQMKVIRSLWCKTHAAEC